MPDFSFEEKTLYSYLGGLAEHLENSEAYIAGGAITSIFCNRKEIADFDVYFRSKKHLAEFLYAIEGTAQRIISYTDKALLLMVDGSTSNILVQAIFFDFFEKPQDIFKKFDFTVCMGAYDFKSRKFVLNSHFLKDNSQRILRFNPKTAFPIMSALRVEKYKGKGYSISKTEYLRVIMTCMESAKNIKSYDELEKQIGGMYGINISNLIDDKLRKKPFSLEKFANAIANLYLEDGYFDNSKSCVTDIDDYEKLVVEITQIKTKAFRWSNAKIVACTVKGKGFVSIDEDELKNYTEVKAEELFSLTHVYKYVKMKPDGELCSFNTPTYKYKVGEMAERLPRDMGLYFVYQPGIYDASFSNSDGAVLIEAEIDRSDIIDEAYIPGAALTVAKAKILRIVPKEEVSQLVNRFGKPEEEFPF